MTAPVDLQAYLARIGWDRPVHADLDTLRGIHRAHVAAIPFENLDIQMGRSIDIDPAAIHADLVARRRGGYCFQQNGLFRLVLTAIGFAPTSCAGRVRLDATGTRPRTHMVLVVPQGDRRWLVDVGFGANGLVEPVALDGEPVFQDGWRYRIQPEGRLLVLQRTAGEGWDDLYVFEDDQVPDIDYVAGNWFTSTHPDSGFVRSLTAQRTVGGTRHILRNLTYSVSREGRWITREISRAELVPLLRETFGLDVGVDARFLAVDGGAGAPAPRP